MSASPPTERQAAARRRWAPSLDRARGRVRFAAHAPPGTAESLAEFLTGRGIRATVAGEMSPSPEVQLAGIPDLDRVDALIGEWTGGPSAPGSPRPAARSRQPTRADATGETSHGAAVSPPPTRRYE